MNWNQLPNLITLVRLLLLFPLSWALAHENYTQALILFVLAGSSDGLDGWLAKRFGWVTRLGAVLDPIADKLLMTLAYGMLTWHGHIPLWLFAIVLGRDLLIVLGAVAYKMLFGDVEMQPAMISKWNTAMQIVFVSLVMLRLGAGIGWPWLETTGLVIVGALGIASGAWYVWIWGGDAWKKTRHKRS